VDFIAGCIASMIFTMTWPISSLNFQEDRRQQDLLGSNDDEEAHSGLTAIGQGSSESLIPTVKPNSGYSTFTSPAIPSTSSIWQVARTNTPLNSLASVLALSLLISSMLLAPNNHPGSLSRPLDQATPIALGCVLPDQPATLSSLIAESTRLASQAKLLVWPETALSLSTAIEREEVLKSVEKLAKAQGVWIAAGLSDVKDIGLSDKVRKRNEVVFVGPHGIIGSYEKRKLVPCE
jgi:apolipoprotein N-acyltransferase